MQKVVSVVVLIIFIFSALALHSPPTYAANEELVKKTVGEIRIYINAHSAATDTLEGVCAYWIQGDVPILIVSLALDWLVQAGEIEQIKIANRDLYRKKK